MGDETIGAVLDTAVKICKVAAALVAQSVERAVAEHAVKDVTLGFMAREIFAFCIFVVFA